VYTKISGTNPPTAQEQIIAYYANRVAEANKAVANVPAPIVLPKKCHNRCNSSGVGIAPSKLLQHKPKEFVGFAPPVLPTGIAPSTAKASEKQKIVIGLEATMHKPTDFQNYITGFRGVVRPEPQRPTQEVLQPKHCQILAPKNNDELQTQAQKRKNETPRTEVVNVPTIIPMNVSGNLNGKLESFVIGKQIGQGAYAIVKVAFHKELGKKVALKIYDKTKLVEPQRQKSVQREIKIMERMNNPFIAKLYEAFDTSKQVILVMEYVRGMSLHGYLKSKTARKLPEWEAKKLFKQVVTGIGYCHNKSITHRDIKLENLLLDENNNIKIIDFGFSTCIPNTKKIKIFCGTPSYMAPEIVARKEYAGPPADIWALGVLLYAMLCGTFPFKGENDKELYKKIIRGYFEVPDHLSTLSKALLLRMLQVDPDKRLTSDQVLLDIWVNSESEAPKPQSSRRKEEHSERSYSHDNLRCNPDEECSDRPKMFYVPKVMNNVSSGGTVNNNFNIVNNITHITYARDAGTTKENDRSIDCDIVNSIIRLGYSNSEITQQMQNEKSHIYLLYNRIKDQKQKFNMPIPPQFVPSIASLNNSRQNSTRSKSKPGIGTDREDEKTSLGSARGNKMASQKNFLFNNTSPFVLHEH